MTAARQKDAGLSIVITGASGALAREKVVPALFSLYCQHRLPEATTILGFGRTTMTDETFRNGLVEHLDDQNRTGTRIDDFLARCGYVSGEYDSTDSFLDVYQRLHEAEPEGPVNRLFYLSVPPFVFPAAARAIGDTGLAGCDRKDGWTRLVVEKPFGSDRESSDTLNRELSYRFRDEQIYRIDHYLGKHIVQNVLVLRFANRVFGPLWCREHVESVRVDWREDAGVEQRGGYFDTYGIIRDVFQNHMLQIVALMAMERPDFLDEDSLHRAKLDTLRAITPVSPDGTVLGQYTAGECGGADLPDYRDEDGVDDASSTATYAATVLHIDNERWRGVPFVLSAGKALDRRLSEVTLNFRHPDHCVFSESNAAQLRPNRLIVRIQPDEGIHLCVMNKRPGLELTLDDTSLDFCYPDKAAADMPSAYEAMLLDVVTGDKTLFIRADESAAAWDVFTPLLKSMAEDKPKPQCYTAGSKGPDWPKELRRHLNVR